MEVEKLRERFGEEKEKETSTNKNTHKSKFHYFFFVFNYGFFFFIDFLIFKIDIYFLKLEVDVARWCGILKYHFNGHISIYCANSALHLPYKIFSLSEWQYEPKWNVFFILGTKSGKIKM